MEAQFKAFHVLENLTHYAGFMLDALTDNIMAKDVLA